MKVLILRFSSIGDIVLTSPVMRCIKTQVGNVEVHYATRKIFSGLVAHSPYVDKVHLLDDDLKPLIEQLRAERFDLVVDLHHNLRSARIKRALGVDHRSFPKLNIEKWLLVNFKKDRLPRIHIVDRYLSTVDHLGVKNDAKGLELFIPAEREVDKNVLPETHRNGYIAMAIGGSHATKRLPLHRMIELAELLDGPLVIIGGKDDIPEGRAITNAIGSRAFDATGKFDLLESASLIRDAKSVIAHDSGAMHIACAFNKKVMSIWGNTVPEFGMGPYMPQKPEYAFISEVKGLPCRPCSKLGYPQCPRGHFRCMEKHDLPALAEFVQQR